MSAACTLESFETTQEFARADDYGGPLAAALAMQISASGLYKTGYKMLPEESVYKTLPDAHTVNAFARRRISGNPDDIETVLGTALSITEIGGQVIFLGQLHALQGYTDRWLNTLGERKKQAQICDRLPAARDIARLLHTDWTVLLHVNGEAFKNPDVEVQPVVVRGMNQRSLFVDNPGAKELPAAVGQRIATRKSLKSYGSTGSPRVSLFAIRKPSADAEDIGEYPAATVYPVS